MAILNYPVYAVRLNNRAGYSSTSRVGQWRPHEIAMVVFGSLLPLGTTGSVGFLGSDALKVAAAALAGWLVVMNIIFLLRETDRPFLTPLDVDRSRVPLLLYLAALVTVSVVLQLELRRFVLLSFFVVAVLGYFVCEHIRPGSFVEITYWAAVIHLIIVVATGQRTDGSWVGERLAGTITPVSVGFDASLVFVISLVSLRRRPSHSSRIIVTAAAALALYELWESFSRAALLSFAIGLVTLLIYRRPRFVPLKLVAAAVGLSWLYTSYVDRAVAFFRLEGNDTASGRTIIWSRLVEYNDRWLSGHGFAALRFPFGGPDEYLWETTSGLPAENALLQAVLMGGVVAGLLWLWLAMRAGHALWSVRNSAGGASLFYGVCLAVNAFLGVGLSGVSFSAWWLLAAFSLATVLRVDASQAPPLAVGGSAVPWGDRKALR